MIPDIIELHLRFANLWRDGHHFVSISMVSLEVVARAAERVSIRLGLLILCLHEIIRVYWQDCLGLEIKTLVDLLVPG